MTKLTDEVARAIDDCWNYGKGTLDANQAAHAALQIVAQWLREENHELVCEMIAAEDSKEANPRTTGNFHSPYFAMLRALASHLEKTVRLRQLARS